MTIEESEECKKLAPELQPPRKGRDEFSSNSEQASEVEVNKRKKTE